MVYACVNYGEAFTLLNRPVPWKLGFTIYTLPDETKHAGGQAIQEDSRFFQENHHYQEYGAGASAGLAYRGKARL